MSSLCLNSGEPSASTLVIQLSLILVPRKVLAAARVTSLPLVGRKFHVILFERLWLREVSIRSS